MSKRAKEKGVANKLVERYVARSVRGSLRPPTPKDTVKCAALRARGVASSAADVFLGFGWADEPTPATPRRLANACPAAAQLFTASGPSPAAESGCLPQPPPPVAARRSARRPGWRRRQRACGEAGARQWPAMSAP